MLMRKRSGIICVLGLTLIGAIVLAALCDYRIKRLAAARTQAQQLAQLHAEIERLRGEWKSMDDAPWDMRRRWQE